MAGPKNSHEQAKPLAPQSHTIYSDQPNNHDDEVPSCDNPKRRYCVVCCGLISAFLLLLSVTFIVLVLTVFHLVNPTITLHSLTFIHRLEIVNGTVRTDRNATLVLDVSVRNPNTAPFAVEDIKAVVYYGGVVIGEGRRNSRGEAPAKQTAQMNLTVEIYSRNLTSVPSLREDLSRREISMSSYISVVGKVKKMKIFKKSSRLKRDCMMKYNSLKLSFQEVVCQTHVKD